MQAAGPPTSVDALGLPSAFNNTILTSGV